MVKLIEISLNNWKEIWKLAVEKIPETMPNLLRQVERISSDELKDKLSPMAKENALKSDNSRTIMT